MCRRPLLLVPSLFVLVSLTARNASATPPDTRAAPAQAPSRAEVAGRPPRAMEGKTPAEAEATAVVEKQLVTPLVAKEQRRNRFSRAYLPPHARRVRILDRVSSTDGRGAAFVAFAVDERSVGFTLDAADDGSGRWRKDAIVGCVYPARGEIFIKRGEAYFAASLLLGQKTAAAGEAVCRPASLAASR